MLPWKEVQSPVASGAKNGRGREALAARGESTGGVSRYPVAPSAAALLRPGPRGASSAAVPRPTPGPSPLPWGGLVAATGSSDLIL